MFNFLIRKGLGALAALAITVSANPALANSASTADIAAPLRAAQAEKPTALGNRDEQFKALFSRWQSMDGSTGTTTKSSVSIPSLMPVEGVRLSSDYGLRTHPVLGGRRGHTGVDLSVLNSVQFLEPTLVAPAGASGGHDARGRPLTYVQALRHLERGDIDVAALITHRYHSLDAVPGAFAGDHLRDDYVKGMVLP